MTKKNRILPALLLSLFAGIGATTAQAQQFSNVYVFGDSLSDTGYYRPFLTTIGVPPSLVSTLGRFTTNPGPIWAELIAQQYGLSALPSNVAGGTVYAQGGARVALPSASTPPGGAQRPVSTQITEYLGSRGTADPNALYTIWAGANDIFQNLALLQAGAITADQLSANIQAAAGAEAAQIARLRAAGARYIMVFNLPNIGATPQFSGAGPVIQGQVTALSVGYNTALFAGLAGLQATGLRVIPVDTFALITEIMANPTAYGFTNTTGVACAPFPPFSSTPNSQFCSSGNLVAPNADQTYVFADGVHPTTASHRITADFVKSLLNGPVQMTLLPESALAARNAHMHSLRDGLATGAKSAQGQWTIFASAVDGDYDIDSGHGTAVGAANAVRAVTGGATVRVSDTVTLGLAAGSNDAKASFGNNAGNYRTRETAVSVIGAVRLDGLFFDGALTYGDLEWNDIRRQFNIGNVVRSTTASTEGTNTSAYLGGGYDFQLNNFSIGPVASVLVQNVDMNGFEETGGGSSNLRYSAFKRRSEVWSVGGRASFDWGNWTPWVRVTVDKERRDDERLMGATPVSMATGNGYDLPGYQPDTSFITSNIGLTGRFSWGALGIAYYNVAKREGATEEGFTASVSFRF